MFASDAQRRAVMAAIRSKMSRGGQVVRNNPVKTGAAASLGIATGANVVRQVRGKAGPIERFQKGFRRYARKHPVAAELAIAVPAFAIGAGLADAGEASRIGVKLLSKGRFTRGITRFGINVPAYAIGDTIARRAMFGSPRKHKYPSTGLIAPLVGGIAGETITRKGGAVARAAVRGIFKV